MTEVYESAMLAVLSGVEQTDRDKLFCLLHDKHNRLVSAVQHALIQVTNKKQSDLFPKTTLSNVTLILEQAANQDQGG